MIYTEAVIILEKAVSKKQQKFFAMVLAVKHGKLSKDKVGANIAKLADSMSDEDVEDFAKTKHKGLPDKAKKS